MSRYEGIRQCGTSSTLRSDGKLVINYNKNTNPMVLHFSGLAFSVGEPEHFIELVPPGKESRQRLLPMPEDPPSLQVERRIVSLQGSLVESTYGFFPEAQGDGVQGIPFLLESKVPDWSCRFLIRCFRTEKPRVVLGVLPTPSRDSEEVGG